VSGTQNREKTDPQAHAVNEYRKNSKDKYSHNKKDHKIAKIIDNNSETVLAYS